MSHRERREQRKQEKIDKQRERQAKSAKFEVEPNPRKEPRAIAVHTDDDLTVQWCFEFFDQTDWRLHKNADHCAFQDIGGQMKNYSARKWSEIKATPGRDHASEVSTLCKAARDRLAELRLDDFEELWRFRFGATQRIWGIRDGRLLKVIWWDPDHQVYPTEPRNT